MSNEIDPIEFGKLVGLVEGMDKKLDAVTEHFVTHAKEDNKRFEEITTSIAFQKGRIQIVAGIISALVAGFIAYFGRH